MSFMQSIKENITHYSEQVKILIFGENNLRLDKLIDRFYSMREEKRKQVRILATVGGIIVFILVLALYFYGLFKLQKDLDHATQAYLQVQELKPDFILVKNEYAQLSSKITTGNSPANLIPAINRVASTLSLQIDGLPATPNVINLPSVSALSQFQKVRIDFQISGVSLKRLMDFLNNVHKLPNKFAVTKLEIIQVLENKLYFNALISLEAYVPKQKKG